MSENTMPSQTTWEVEPSQPQLQADPLPTSKTPVSPEDAETLTLRRSHLYAMLLPLAFVVGLSVGYLFWGRTPTIPPGSTGGTSSVDAPTTSFASQNQAQVQAQPQGNPASPTQNQQPETEQIVRYDVPVDDDPFYGPENAPITIIEFSDFECPYCRKWHVEVFQRLLDTYQGQIKFVYRDFPLTSIHPNAFPAAEAANCAGEQGVYWPYHNMLFSMELGLSTESYQQYAQELGINVETFNACMAEGKYKAEIQADFEYAAQLGVRSTPTFFINGIAVVGAQSFEVFQQVIEKELAGEIP